MKEEDVVIVGEDWKEGDYDRGGSKAKLGAYDVAARGISANIRLLDPRACVGLDPFIPGRRVEVVVVVVVNGGLWCRRRCCGVEGENDGEDGEEKILMERLRKEWRRLRCRRAVSG